MNQNRRLRLVDDTYTFARRAYILNLDALDFASHVTTLEDKGMIVINGDEDQIIDDVDMRLHLQALASADVLGLPDIWWTSTRAHQLVTVAGWLGIEFVNQHGSRIETVGAAR